MWTGSCIGPVYGTHVSYRPMEAEIDHRPSSIWALDCLSGPFSRGRTFFRSSLGPGSAFRHHQVMCFDIQFHERFFFHLLLQALFPDSRLPSSFNPVRSSFAALLARPHEALPVDLIKTRLQQGDASLGTKSALPVLMRTNLTFSVQSSGCHSLHHTVDRLFLRGTRSLARHIRIVNPVHSFASS
jgi:hypothetical protein